LSSGTRHEPAQKNKEAIRIAVLKRIEELQTRTQIPTPKQYALAAAHIE